MPRTRPFTALPQSILEWIIILVVVAVLILVHEGGAYGVTAEGSVQFLEDDMPAGELRLFIERSDGQPTPEF